MVSVRYHESECEEVFIQRLCEVGWSYIPGCEMAGRRITDVIYEPDLMAYLQAKYGGGGLTALDYQQMIAKLRNTLIKGALSPEIMLEILRDYVYFADEAEARRIRCSSSPVN